MFKENTDHLHYDVFGVETYLPQKQLKKLKIKTDIQRSDSFLAASNIRKYNRIMLLNVLMLLYTSLSFGACDKKVQEKSDVPDWITNVPEVENAFVAVGSGDGRAMALCNALKDLAVRVKVTVEGYTSGDTSLSRYVFEQRLGKMTVKGSIDDRSFYFASDTDTLIRYDFRLTTNVFFEDGEKFFSIKEFVNEHGVNNQSNFTSDIEIRSRNSGVGDLLRELNLLGIEIESYAGADAYYFKLMAEEDMLKNYEKLGTDGFFEELEEGKEG